MAKDDFLTAFDVSYRDTLDTTLTTFVDNALAEGRVLTVTADRPAVDLARHVEDTKADVVIVVDQRRATRGYVFPEWVTQQVMARRGGMLSSFTEAINVVTGDSIDIGRDHFHEWLNFDRPVDQECPGPPRHLTLGPIPCRKHS